MMATNRQEQELMELENNLAPMKAEIARLLLALQLRDQMLASNVATISALQTELLYASSTIHSQAKTIADLSRSVDKNIEKIKIKDQELEAVRKSKNSEIDVIIKLKDADIEAIIKLKNAEIDQIQRSMEAAAQTHSAELMELQEDMIPLWALGARIRMRKLQFDGAAPGTLSLGNKIIREGNRAAHDSHPVADATLFLFDWTNMTAEDKILYEQRYCVPVSVAYNLRKFKRFITLLKMHDDFQRWTKAGSIRKDKADMFLTGIKLLIGRVYPRRVFKSDEDFRNDRVSADLLRRLIQEARYTQARDDEMRYRVRR